MTYEPEIIGFCCSWSGYQNSKVLNDPSLNGLKCKAELYPVECAGAIPSFLVMDALEKGIDGVFICSCGDGLCQYFEGDKKLDHKVTMFEALLEDLGIEPERVALAKVSDRQGEMFDEALGAFIKTLQELGPSPMKEDTKLAPGIKVWPEREIGPIKDLLSNAREMGVLQCLECGKCTASCPVAEVKADFSPMYIVEKALRNLDAELGGTSDVWNCLTMSCISSKSWAWVVTSSAVVGSSAINILGLQESPMAIMTLCRMPPLKL